MTCSKCEKLSAHAILVQEDKEELRPENNDGKDLRSIRVFRFCKNHWTDLEMCLP